MGGVQKILLEKDIEGTLDKRYLPLTGGDISGTLTIGKDLHVKNYFDIDAWTGYGTGSTRLWYDGTDRTIKSQGGATSIALKSTSTDKLATARSINGVKFDGSTDIQISAELPEMFYGIPCLKTEFPYGEWNSESTAQSDAPAINTEMQEIVKTMFTQYISHGGDYNIDSDGLEFPIILWYANYISIGTVHAYGVEVSEEELITPYSYFDIKMTLTDEEGKDGTTTVRINSSGTVTHYFYSGIRPSMSDSGRIKYTGNWEAYPEQTFEEIPEGYNSNKLTFYAQPYFTKVHDLITLNGIAQKKDTTDGTFTPGEIIGTISKELVPNRSIIIACPSDGGTFQQVKIIGKQDPPQGTTTGQILIGDTVTGKKFISFGSVCYYNF